jgi:hypothetical protein
MTMSAARKFAKISRGNIGDARRRERVLELRDDQRRRMSGVGEREGPAALIEEWRRSPS